MIYLFISENKIYQHNGKISGKYILYLFNKDTAMENKLLKSFKNHFKKRLLKKFSQTVIKLNAGTPIYKNIALNFQDDFFEK